MKFRGKDDCCIRITMIFCQIFLNNVPQSLIELAKRIGRFGDNIYETSGSFASSFKSVIAGITIGDDLSLHWCVIMNNVGRSIIAVRSVRCRHHPSGVGTPRQICALCQSIFCQRQKDSHRNKDNLCHRLHFAWPFSSNCMETCDWCTHIPDEQHIVR